MVPTIDFHNHFYPKAYLDGLKKYGKHATVGADDSGRLLVSYEGDYNVVAGGHVNLDVRLKDMERSEVDTQVLTLTTPGVERETSEVGIKLSRLTNDAFGDITERYPNKFVALAALPMQDPQAATEELERAVNDRGLRGATIFSNIAGKTIDRSEFTPIYQKAEELDVPIFIHPTSPINSEAMEDYRLVPIIGFGVDTSLAVLRLVFSGVMEKYPNLKIVVTHTGGVFPYLRGRIETAYNSYPETREHLSKPPSYYLKRMWLDTVSYDPDVLASSLAFWGPEKLVLGSDYPHQIGYLDKCVNKVRELKIEDEKKKMILGGNAAKLLKLQ